MVLVHCSKTTVIELPNELAEPKKPEKIVLGQYVYHTLCTPNYTLSTLDRSILNHLISPIPLGGVNIFFWSYVLFVTMEASKKVSCRH